MLIIACLVLDFLQPLVNIHSVVAENWKNTINNQRPGWSSLIYRSAWKTQTLTSTFWTCLLSSFVKIHSVVAEEKSKNVSADQRPGGGHFLVTDRHEKHILGTGGWELASWQVSSKSAQRFLRRSRKCEKLTTDDGHHMITIAHTSLWFMCAIELFFLYQNKFWMESTTRTFNVLV